MALAVVERPLAFISAGKKWLIYEDVEESRSATMSIPSLVPGEERQMEEKSTTLSKGHRCVISLFI